MCRIGKPICLIVMMFYFIAAFLSAAVIAQESNHSVSQSSEYAPPTSMPDLEELSVYLEHLKEFDIEIADILSQPEEPAVSAAPVPQVTNRPVNSTAVIVSHTQSSPVIQPPQVLELAAEPAATNLPLAIAPAVKTPVSESDSANGPLVPKPLSSGAQTTIPERFVLSVRGTGSEVVRQVPDETGTTTGYLDARCYVTDVFDTPTGDKLGFVEQCLSEISTGIATPTLSGKQMIETTIFHLSQGRLVVQEVSTLQPLNWSSSDDEGNQYTHMTGSRSDGNALIQSGDKGFSSTGGFEERRVRFRSSGMIDLSREQEGVISMDSVFVLDLS